MIRSFLACVVLAVTAVGCSSSSSTPATVSKGAALNDFIPVFCSKVKDCFPEGFATAYPGGLDDCKQKAVQSAGDLTTQDACSQTEVDNCTKDTANIACPATPDQIKLPSSCDKC